LSRAKVAPHLKKFGVSTTLPKWMIDAIQDDGFDVPKFLALLVESYFRNRPGTILDAAKGLKNEAALIIERAEAEAAPILARAAELEETAARAEDKVILLKPHINWDDARTRRLYEWALTQVKATPQGRHPQDHLLRVLKGSGYEPDAIAAGMVDVHDAVDQLIKAMRARGDVTAEEAGVVPSEIATR
jgi:hypothetical protein